MTRFWIMLVMAASSVTAWGADQNPPAILREHDFLVGHNLTATSDVLDGKTCSLGLQVLACRVGARTALGLSPWMLTNYRMYAVALRHVFSEDGEGNRWGGQVSYYQTWTKRGPNDINYEMTALWLQGIRTYQVRDDYRLHLNVDVNYYFDDTMPFSLRRPSLTRSPWQFNVTSLHQVALTKGWFILGELGLLDVFRKPLHTHSGVSIGWENSWLSWHLGYSVSASLEAFFNPTYRIDYQQVLLAYPGATFHDQLDPGSTYNDYGLHPEFALQATF